MSLPCTFEKMSLHKDPQNHVHPVKKLLEIIVQYLLEPLSYNTNCTLLVLFSPLCSLCLSVRYIFLNLEPLNLELLHIFSLFPQFLQFIYKGSGLKTQTQGL